MHRHQRGTGSESLSSGHLHSSCSKTWGVFHRGGAESLFQSQACWFLLGFSSSLSSCPGRCSSDQWAGRQRVVVWVWLRERRRLMSCPSGKKKKKEYIPRQCCVHFYSTAKWFSHTYTYISPWFPSHLGHRRAPKFPVLTVGFHICFIHTTAQELGGTGMAAEERYIPLYPPWFPTREHQPWLDQRSLSALILELGQKRIMVFSLEKPETPSSGRP